MNNQVWSLVGVLGLLGGPMTATAKTIIAFEFVGQVTHVEFELDGQFAAGDIFSGIYRFDSELHDLFPEPERGFYEPLGFGHVTVESGRPDVANYLALIRDGHGDISVGTKPFP